MKQPIQFSRARLVLLKDQYATARGAGQDSFVLTLEDDSRHELVTSYAKYLIEHLETQFKAHPDQPAAPNREGEEGQ